MSGLPSENKRRAAIALPLSQRQYGLNVLGYMNSEKGLGEAVRANVRSIRAAGLPHVLNDYPDIHSANEDRTLKGFSRFNPFYINLIQLNAGEALELLERIGDWYYQWKYNVGFWYWELPKLPQSYHCNFDYYDEIWVASTFVRDCLLECSPVPVRLLPPSLPPIEKQMKLLSRERFGLPRDEYIFLTVFDHWSTLERKNPMGVLQAFREAFGPKDRATLVIKSSHAKDFPAAAEALRKSAVGLRVLFIDEVLPRPELYGLMNLCDCYVSLHRSEGFGMPLAEAMALGKPVIATGYSGNLDFMNEANSLLVRHKLVALEADAGVYEKGNHWAEPETAHAASLMRRVFQEKEFSRSLGAAAKRDVRERLSAEKIGQTLQTVVDEIGARVGLFRDPALPKGSFGRPPKAKRFGINVAGFITSETGLGEAVRANIAAIEADAVPHVLNNIEVSISESVDKTYQEFSTKNPFFVNLIQVNASEDLRFQKSKGNRYYQWKHNVGYWYWELPEFPEGYAQNFNLYDEIWVASTFTQKAVSEVSPIPVFKIPPSLQPLPQRDLQEARGRLGIDPRATVFLFNFSFGSCPERKNPVGLARAFRKAFGDRRDVLLVIKSGHSKKFPEDLARLQEELKGLSCLHLDKILERDDLIDFYNAADCYVSLHRSEGFGLPLAHAMTLAKPVIATGYSGNTDFMTAENSFLVKYQLGRLEKAWGPYPEGSIWADPDIAHAAELMRAVQEDPARAAAVGARARSEILRQLDPASLGRDIRKRLDEIFAMRGIRREAVADYDPASRRPAPSR